MIVRSYPYPNAGVFFYPDTSMSFAVTSADGARRALVGCHPDQVENLSQLGQHILVNGHPEHPSDMKRSASAEISARLTNGLDSETAGASTLALVLCQLEMTGRLPEAMECAGAGTLEFRLGAEIGDPVTLTSLPAPEFMADPGSKKALAEGIWAGEAKAPSVLQVHIDDLEAELFQSLHMASKKVKALIRRVEKEAAVFHQDARRTLVMSSTMAVIRAYHLSLAGDSFGLPVTKWDWLDARDLVAGRIAWLLREEGLLEASLSRADNASLHISYTTSTWKLRLDEQVDAA